MQKNIVDFSRAVAFSIDWTKNTLSNPFSFKKLLIFSFVAWLAGGFGGGFNFTDINRIYDLRQQDHSTQITAHQRTGSDYIIVNGVEKRLRPLAKTIVGAAAALGNATIAVIVTIFLAIVAFFYWLQARFTFVFLEDTVKNDASIAAPFSEYKNEASSLFRFNIIFALLVLTAIASLFIYLTTMLPPGTHAPDNVTWRIILPFIAPFAIVLMVAAIIYALIMDFVVPVMVRQRMLLVPAFKETLRLFRHNKKNVILYLCLKLVLGILSAVIYFTGFMIAILLLLLIAMAAAIVFFGVSRFIPGAGGQIFWGTIVTVLITAGISAIILSAVMIATPFAIFFRTLSLHLLGQLSSEYDFFKQQQNAVNATTNTY